MSTSEPSASILPEPVSSDTYSNPSTETKPKREYVIQILNAIEELKRDEWNALLDANSR